MVDDGSPSSDRGRNIVQDNYVQPLGSDLIRLCQLYKNKGKGGAVRMGMLRARGEYILMADADGATRASDLGTLLERVQKLAADSDGLGIAVGSRADANDEASKANRTFLRRLLGLVFHSLIAVMVGGLSIRDTQCGFKLFTRK